MILDAWHIEFTPPRHCDFDPVASLFREYARELGVDLTFQGFDDEVANLLVITGHQTAPCSSLVPRLATRSAVWPCARSLRLAPAR